MSRAKTGLVFFSMLKTRMPHSNIMNKVQWEGIEMCEMFGGTRLLVRQLKASRLGRWCSARKGGLPGDWIHLVLMQWRHADMDLSDWPHVDMV